MKSKLPSFSSESAARELGLTVSQFRRVVNDREPDDTDEFTVGRKRVVRHLWSRRTIAALRRTNMVKAALARKGGASPKDYAATFAKLYDAPRAALADACEALFNLNRYTRLSTCSSKNRKEIHELKSALIEHVYKAEEFTDRVEELTKTLPAKQCYGCDGEGCERCDDTGEYLPEKEVATYVFTFTVDGRRFCWMQPDHACSFVPTVEESRPDDGTRGPLETEMNIPRARLAEAKALVRWVLGEKAPKFYYETQADRLDWRSR